MVAVTAEADRLDHVSDAERMIGDLLRVVREELRLEVVFLGEFVDGQRIFRHVSAKQLPDGLKLGGSNSLEDTLCQRIVDGRMPSVLESVARVRASYGLSSAYERLGAHIGVPVRFTDGSLYGVLCGFSFEAREDLSERDVQRLVMAANAAGRFLAQADGQDVTRPLPPWE
ncbi:GAF domain-containing protein [Variovorax sp. J31P179]|nr:GAF domain-containing protein [Variovorax sp. J31P179]